MGAKRAATQRKEAGGQVGNKEGLHSFIIGNNNYCPLRMKEEEIITPEVVEAMGISQPAFEEIQCIIGRMPTVQELSTLLAMWEANGRQQSLYGWLKGQHHVVVKNEYLYTDDDETHKGIKEPRVKDCIALARELMRDWTPQQTDDPIHFANHGELIYMVGKVSTRFLDSEYARRCLHLASDPMVMDSIEEEMAYHEMILDSLWQGQVLHSKDQVGMGGLFATLVRDAACLPKPRGFDILTCREIRLDAFLFGEEPGRFVVSLPESQDDFFLLKMDEARVNCCFLGKVTRGRVLVDDMDYGPIEDYYQHE